MSHSGQLLTKRVSLSWVARQRRGLSPSQSLPYLCHSCIILPGNEIFKKTKAVEADDRGYYEIAVRIKEKGTSKECKFHSSPQQSPRSLKNQKGEKKTKKTTSSAWEELTYLFLLSKCLSKSPVSQKARQNAC